MYGHRVALFDQAKTVRDAAPDRIAKDLQFMVDNGFISAERRKSTLGNLRVCGSLEEAGRDALRSGGNRRNCHRQGGTVWNAGYHLQP